MNNRLPARQESLRCGLIFALFLALGVAACTAKPPPRLTNAPPAQSSAPWTDTGMAHAAEAAPQNSGLPQTNSVSAAESGASRAPIAEKAAAIPPTAEQPAELIGITGRVLSERLGRPDFVQRDGPAEIWRYAGTDCFLDVFLYQKSGDLQVAHYEVRNGGDKARSLQPIGIAANCYRALRAHRVSRPG